MPEAFVILGVAGSLRKGSFNRMALQAARQLVPTDTRLEAFDRIGEFPLFNQDQERNPPSAVQDFKSKIRSAQAVLLITPEYNYSIPGVLKNAIDWASRPYGDNAWNGKPVAIMGAATGNLGTARAQYHLRQIFVFLNMYCVNQPEVLIGNAQQKFDEHGNLRDEVAKELIAQLLQNLVALTKKIS